MIEMVSDLRFCMIIVIMVVGHERAATMINGGQAQAWLRQPLPLVSRCLLGRGCWDLTDDQSHRVSVYGYPTTWMVRNQHTARSPGGAGAALGRDVAQPVAARGVAPEVGKAEVGPARRVAAVLQLDKMVG